MSVLKSLKEDLCRVHGSAVESIFLRADNTWVSNAAEIDSELLVIVSSKLLIEDLRHTVHGSGLKDRVNWGLVLLELVTTEGSNSRRQEDLALVLSGNVQG